MVLVYLLFGMLTGMVSFVASLILGASFWSALLLYSLVGGAMMALLPLMRMAQVKAAGALQDRLAFAEADLLAAPASAGAPEPARPAQPVQDGAMRILAVDDDPFILELIPKIAARVGCPDVTTASSAEQALELLSTSPVPFECLLLDINMPDMDGIALCARVRALSPYWDVPIIMLTAMTDMDYLDRAFRAGATDYTSKPFDIIEFGDRLQIAQARTMARRAGRDHSQDHDGAHEQAATPIVRLRGVRSLIEYPALQNYLTRLTGSAIANTYVMAVLVEPVDTVDAPEPRVLRRQALGHVVRAIDDVFGNSRCVMAYAGRGMFVLVSNAAALPRSSTIEASIQSRLDALAADTGNTALVSVGMPVRPGSGRAQRAATAFDSAIGLARDRAAGKHRTTGRSGTTDT